MDIELMVKTFLAQQAQLHPKLLAFLVLVGAARMFMKPIMTAVHELTKATLTPKDDELLAKLEASRVWVCGAFLVDLITSVKLPAAPGPGPAGLGKLPGIDP